MTGWPPQAAACCTSRVARASLRRERHIWVWRGGRPGHRRSRPSATVIDLLPLSPMRRRRPGRNLRFHALGRATAEAPLLLAWAFGRVAAEAPPDTLSEPAAGVVVWGQPGRGRKAGAHRRRKGCRGRDGASLVLETRTRGRHRTGRRAGRKDRTALVGPLCTVLGKKRMSSERKGKSLTSSDT